jgi:glycosyltransferase involved in cell wall biosynthesis
MYNNTDELIDALKKLAENRGLRDDLGSKGHAAFLKYWNEDAHLAQYFGLIDTIQNKRAKAAKSTCFETVFEV